MGCYMSHELSIRESTLLSDDLNSKIEKKLENTRFHGELDSPNTARVLEKTEILAQYKFYGTLGKGMFCEVRLAKEQGGRLVAVKIIRKKFFADRDSIKKIIIEKEIMNSLDHRHILKLYRTFQTNSRLFFVLEFAQRGNLLGLINSKAAFMETELQLVAAQIILALLYMHSKGIIYGDLKAENVLFTKEGLLKLCDFNLSGTTKLLDKTIQGTTSYLAPEIIQEAPKTPKSDFWSLGILLHLMFYKKHAFSGPTQGAVLASIVDDEVKCEPPYRVAPARLRRLILDLLVKNPRNRIGNSLDEFKRHEFFRDFEWREDLALPEDCFPKPKDNDKLTNSGNDTLNQTMNNPVYDIADFTFDSKAPSEKVQGRADRDGPQQIGRRFS